MKAAINALTLHTMSQEDWAIPMSEARAFAESFFEENAELFAQQVTVRPTKVTREPGGPTVVTGEVEEPVERARVHRVSIVGSDGLTDRQRAAVGNVGLCPNCQQPNNAHLPGCARASGEAPKAVTKTPLPPVE